MADYKESIVSGTSWQRTNQIVIVNPFGGTPTVIYNEETAINLGGGKVVTTPCGNLSVTCADMTDAIPLLDPVTGLPVSTSAGATSMTIGQMMVGIYSHYIYSAKKRDAAVVTTP